MRLNFDCIRQILLCVEANTELRKQCFFIDQGLEEIAVMIGDSPIPLPDYQVELQKKYDNNELIYHINYCIEADLLSTNCPADQYQIFITDLTPHGHDFIEKIRDNKIWSSVKETAAKVGAKSMDSIIQIASNIITQLIRSQFGI